MENTQELFRFTMNLLESKGIHHESTMFDSGAIMIDVWHNGKFYVIQFDTDGFIGFSEVNENIGFDCNPDEKFYDSTKYKHKLNSIIVNE